MFRVQEKYDRRQCNRKRPARKAGFGAQRPRRALLRQDRLCGRRHRPHRGPERCKIQRTSGDPRRLSRARAQPRKDVRRRRPPLGGGKSRLRRPRLFDGRDGADAGGGRAARPRRRPARRPARRARGADRERISPGRISGPLHHGPRQSQQTAADGHPRHRQHDPDRPRPARTDHRRPADWQDRHRRRHHPQPAGAGCRLHLCRHRPEGVLARQDGQHPPQRRGDGIYLRRLLHGGRPRPAAIFGAVQRLRPRRVLHVPREGRAHRL